MFWRRHEDVEGMLQRYFDRCDECLGYFEAAMERYFEEGLSEGFRDAVGDIHSAEAVADDQRREIEYLLYGKALLPESRGDLLGLLETYDKLPNMLETIAFMLECQRMEMPAGLSRQFRELTRLNVESYRLARRAVDILMSNPKGTLHTTKAVELKESESDRVERDLIRTLFAQDWDMGRKLAYKELVLLLGEISDRAEKVADRIAIIAIKRQV